LLIALSRWSRRSAILVLFAALAQSCMQTRDLGSDAPHGLLPVDERNPVLLANDGAFDSWQGEYAVLLANSGGPKLAGIIVGTSPNWPDIGANIAGWRELVGAARMAGLRNIPDPITSIGPPLVRPANNLIEATVPNRSEGALLIREASTRLSLPYRPLVVVTGGRLTDVADAYLIDPSVADRVVVVSSLGTVSSTGGAMGAPNGEMDAWADAIVSTRFRFVQVSAFYNQLGDLPASRLSALPVNAFGDWMTAKQSKVWAIPQSADQVGILAVGDPAFVAAVEAVSPAGLPQGTNAGPDLLADPSGERLLVTQIANGEASARLWRALRDPATFAP
jgi:hypothetical protein